MVAEQGPEPFPEKHVAQGTVLLPTWPGPAASCILARGSRERAETGTEGQQKPGRSRGTGFCFDPFFRKKGMPKPGENRAKLEGTERRGGWERACWQPAFGARGAACFKTCPSIWDCLATAATCQPVIFWLSKMPPPAFVECFYYSKL